MWAEPGRHHHRTTLGPIFRPKFVRATALKGTTVEGMHVWQRGAAGKAAAVDTVIGPQCVVRGRLEGCGIIRVEGRFEGDIATEGDVIVGEAGEVHASVSARDILVGGLIRGDVQATGRLEILGTGRLTGDINARNLVIAEGAVFTGRCETATAIGPDTRPIVSAPAVVAVESEAPRAAATAVAPRTKEAMVPDPQRSEELRSRLRAVTAVATSSPGLRE